MFSRSPSLDSHRKAYIPSTAGNSIPRPPPLFPAESLQMDEVLSRRLDIDDWRRRAESTKQSVLLEQIDRRVMGDMVAENEKLNDLVRMQRVEIEQLKHKLDVDYRDYRDSSELEKAHLVDRISKMELEHQADIDKLMLEISKLCEECSLIENAKRLEIEQLAEQFDKDLLGQLQQTRKVQDTNIEVCQLQIRNMKETADSRAQETEMLKHEHLIKEMKLVEEIKSLESKLGHELQMKDIELRELREQLQQETDHKVRNIQKTQEITVSNSESTLRKLRKELADKILQLQKLQHRMNRSGSEYEEEIQVIQSQKDRIRLQLSVAENNFRDQIIKEKERLNRLSERQIQTLIDSNVCYANSLKSEVQKLYEMSEIKTMEIQRLNHENLGLRGVYKNEIQLFRKDNIDLNRRLKELELDNKTQIETLKIKMGELHFHDVKGLEDLHQHNAGLMVQQILVQDALTRENRERVHKELQEKELLRKSFEVELSKERSKCLDLKVKLAACTVEMKEQITSMASKMELTSQTLLRETENKQKGAVFFEEERRKLHQLIKAKDTEISGLQENLERLKEEISELDKNHAAQIGNLKSLIDQLDESSKKQKSFYEGEMDKLGRKNRQNKDSLESEMEKSKDSLLKPLQFQIDDLNRDKAKLLKDLENSQRDHKMVQQNLAHKEGMYETIQLESMAAIEEEKTKIKVQMNQNEMSLKTYFEQKVKSREREIASLKEQLKQKDVDLRALISKYNELENKLSQMLKVYDRFSVLEERIMGLGMDNNLVKNMAELFKV